MAKPARSHPAEPRHQAGEFRRRKPVPVGKRNVIGRVGAVSACAAGRQQYQWCSGRAHRTIGGVSGAPGYRLRDSRRGNVPPGTVRRQVGWRQGRPGGDAADRLSPRYSACGRHGQRQPDSVAMVPVAQVPATAGTAGGAGNRTGDESRFGSVIRGGGRRSSTAGGDGMPASRNRSSSASTGGIADILFGRPNGNV